MGERIFIKQIQIIEQKQMDRTLLQIDIWFEDQDKGGRIFLDTREFFKLLCDAKK